MPDILFLICCVPPPKWPICRHGVLQMPLLERCNTARSLLGGALLSLDLSKAFVSISRHHLFSGMADLGVRPDCLQLLYEWHRGTHYDIQHKGFATSIPVFKGVRQGCKAAPFLWRCFTTILLNKLASRTSWEWVNRYVTVYADDFLVHQAFQSLDDFSEFVRNCGILLDVLTEFQLQINLQKCYSMISMQGSALRKAQAKHLKQTASGWHICFPRNHTDAAMVGLHTTVPYLGIQLSYKTLQTSTLQHRLQCGLRAFQRLRTWLCSKRGLTCKQRESLWCSVVRTTTLYGVQVIGCSPAGLRRLLSRLTIQQRMFMQDHSHVMHRSHREFHELFDIEPPAVFLRRLCIRTLRGGADRLANLEATDILHTVRYTETDRLISLLDDWIVSQARGVDVIRPAFQCRTCLETFNSAILLTKHEHQIHSRGRSRCFQFRLD